MPIGEPSRQPIPPGDRSFDRLVSVLVEEQLSDDLSSIFSLLTYRLRPEPAGQAEVAAAGEVAAAAFERFGAHLDRLAGRAHGEWAIGEARYDALLRERCAVVPSAPFSREMVAVAHYSVPPPLAAGDHPGHFYVPYPPPDATPEQVAARLATNNLTGALEIDRLRRRWIAEQRGSLREFHDRAAASGRLPISLAEGVLWGPDGDDGGHGADGAVGT